MASMPKLKIVLSCFLCSLGTFCLVNANRINIPVESRAKNADNPDDNHIVLTIEDGTIKGRKDATVSGNKTYYVFQGIPFAKPPVGELRFKPPEKNSKWNGTLDATQDQSECVQGAVPVTGSEDCLYINVYTPSLTKKNQPVMAWIYGGAFIGGNSSYATFGPDYLLDEDVIFVSFNYRLGVFGFISTEDLACPGNLGLKDQILALKWVQRNIEYFGGDPTQVTIFGESAGAASVGYLLLAKETKGLYKAAILESGSPLCLWALNRRARETAFAIGAPLGILTFNSTELIDGLRKIDFKILQDVATTISTFQTVKNPLAGIMFGPVKEPYHYGAIYYNDSEELISQGNFQRVPILAGFNSNEGAAARDIPAILRLYLLKYDIVPSQLAPADLTDNELKIRAAGRSIKQHYFGILPLAVQTNSVIKFVSDDQFNRPIRRMIQDASKYVPTSTYLYKFSYEGVLGGVVNRSLKGVGHAEELGYIFRTDSQYSVSRKDIRIRQRMVKLWTNFAKHNNPTPTKDKLFQNVTWLPAKSTSNILTYLDINTDMKLLTDPFKKDMAFWDKIYRDYGDPPYDTY